MSAESISNCISKIRACISLQEESRKVLAPVNSDDPLDDRREEEEESGVEAEDDWNSADDICIQTEDDNSSCFSADDVDGSPSVVEKRRGQRCSRFQKSRSKRLKKRRRSDTQQHRSSAGGSNNNSNSGAAAAHLLIVADLRTKLSEAAGAHAALANDVARLQGEAAERQGVIDSQLKRMGAVNARYEALRGKVEGLLADRLEDRRLIKDLTERSLHATAREEAFAADARSWGEYVALLEKSMAQYLKASALHAALCCRQRKELMLLRSMARLWPCGGSFLRVASLIEEERDALREGVDRMGMELATVSTAHAMTVRGLEEGLAATADTLMAANRKIASLEHAIQKQVCLITLPPLPSSSSSSRFLTDPAVASPVVAEDQPAAEEENRVEPSHTGLNDDVGMKVMARSATPQSLRAPATLVVVGADGHVATSDSPSSGAATAVAVNNAAPPSLEVERSTRRSLEEQLARLLSSRLARVEDAARVLGLGAGGGGGSTAEGVEEDSDNVGKQIANNGNSNALAQISAPVTTTITTHTPSLSSSALGAQYQALLQRHECLESTHTHLQQSFCESEERFNAQITREVQALQHYLVHLETELSSTGYAPPPLRPQQQQHQNTVNNQSRHQQQRQGANQQRNPDSFHNQQAQFAYGQQQQPTANLQHCPANGAASLGSGTCFVCQQQCPAARSVRCVRCPKIFHKSCCGFPKNEANYVCCAGGAPATTSGRRTRQAVHYH